MHGKTESGSDLVGLAEGQRGSKLAAQIYSFMRRLLGKLRRVREARAKRDRVFSNLFKSQGRSKKIGSGLESFPTHCVLHIFFSNTYLAFFSELYLRGYTYSPLYTGPEN